MIHGSAYTNTMMVELGERLYFAAGSDKNMKLTTKDDLEMFKAYLKAEIFLILVVCFHFERYLIQFSAFLGKQGLSSR